MLTVHLYRITEGDPIPCLASFCPWRHSLSWGHISPISIFITTLPLSLLCPFITPSASPYKDRDDLLSTPKVINAKILNLIISFERCRANFDRTILIRYSSHQGMKSISLPIIRANSRTCIGGEEMTLYQFLALVTWLVSKVYFLGLKRWISGWEHLLLFERTRHTFPAAGTWWFCNSSLWGSNRF